MNGENSPLGRRYNANGMSSRFPICLLALIAVLPSNSGVSKWTHDMQIKADQVWTDTGIDLKAGDDLQITATGSLAYSATDKSDPGGMARHWKDLLRMLPLSNSGRGALIGRIGGADVGQPFLVGAQKQMSCPVAGRLFLGVNEEENDVAEGTYAVKIEITQGNSAVGPSTATLASLPAFTQAMLDQIPTRVQDEQGDPGDRVNFVIAGSQDQTLAAFTQAGWVQVDKTRRDAVLHGIIASISKESYTELPMSELYLFGRPQDYGLAHAEPFTVVATRHHLRLWKTALAAGGSTIWAGAGTHDIGLEKDQRNGGTTHKIDPDVDKEREFIAQSLKATGLVAKMTYMMPSHPVKDARTATGGSFHSDGRTLILFLTPASGQKTAATN